MFISYVIRLRADELDRGRVAGEIEGVASGQRFKVRSVEQLIAFIMETRSSERYATHTGANVLDESWP